jgi:methylated-DNA-[protein]-cysteine S-methyltransferase
MEFSSIFETDKGRGVIVASESGISRIYLPDEDALQSAGLVRIVPSGLTERVSLMLKHYFNGVVQPFENIPLDIGVSGDFRRRILELVRSIPFGEVWSYAQVACMAGSPGAARAVGGAMAANPVPVIIPCHRVVAADGRLTGFSGPGGLEMKKYLLKMERVEFKGERTIQKINVINR